MKYWKYALCPPCWVEIWCERVHKGNLSFSEKKNVYKELKGFENELSGKFGLLGWITWTELQNDHIMRILHRFGGVPYMIKDNRLYFRKIINGGA